MKNFLLFLWEILKITIIAFLIVLPIRYYVFQPFIVKGESMEPNFENGNYLIVDELSYHFRDPQRGEVVVFKYPKNPSQRYIKRVIGLPGETVKIKDGKITIYKENSSPITLEEFGYLPFSHYTEGNLAIKLGSNEYFVLGDNRTGNRSYDSRWWGPVPRENIIGRVLIRAWPLAELKFFGLPQYQFNQEVKR